MSQDSTATYVSDAAAQQVPWRTLRHWLTVALLALSDILVFAIAYLIFRTGQPAPALMFMWAGYGAPPIDTYVILTGGFVLTRYLSGDYSRRMPFWDLTRRSTYALLLVAALDLIFSFVIHQNYELPVSTFFMWAAILPAIPFGRQITKRLLSAAGLWQIPTLLIGGGEHLIEALSALKTSVGLGYNVQHIVVTAGSFSPEAYAGYSGVVSYLEDPGAVARLAANTGCRQAVVAMQDLTRMSEVMHRLIGLNMDVTVIPPFRRLPLFGMNASLFFGRDILLLQVRNNLSRIPSRIMKRSFDIVGSSILLLLFAPIFVIVSAIIRKEDGGPAFFAQDRVGRRGREFPCLKFRTMKVDAESILTSWETEQPHLVEQYRTSNFKLQDDPRVTRIGRWLRRTSLDEIPQLINVLLGQMSLTGPRPLLARELACYGTAIELYQMVRPGITGLWQINGRSNTTFQDRITYDEWYIKNWSMWYDIVILLRTARVMFDTKSGAY